MKVYLVLSDTGSLLNTMIKKYTKENYNHASLSLDINLEQVYSFGRLKPKNPFVAGFVREDFLGGLSDYFSNTKIFVVEIKVSKTEYEDILRGIQFFTNRKNDYNYNIKGLVCHSVGYNYQNENSYYCTQFVYILLEYAKILKSRNLYKLTCLELFNEIKKQRKYKVIYEGLLLDYIGKSIDKSMINKYNSLKLIVNNIVK